MADAEARKTLMEIHAARVAAARRELELAQAGLERGGPAAEIRYAWALYELDLVQGMFAGVARGAGDVQA